MTFAVVVTEYTGCFYWRIRVPFLALAERGHTVRFLDACHPGQHEVGAHEVMVVQRNPHKWVTEAVEAHRRKGGKVVFEIDDDVHSLHPSNPSAAFYKRGGEPLREIERQMASADLLIVSTPRLAREYARFNSNVALCYNAADRADIAPYLGCDEPEDDGEIRLGWAGSVTHDLDFTTVVAPLTKVMREFVNVRFIFIGGNMRRQFPGDVAARMRHAGGTNQGTIFHPPSIAYMALIAKQKLHAAIAPLAPMTFNGSRSYCKLVEYGALGIPAAATRFGPYLEYDTVSPGCVLTPCTEKEWEDALRRLVTDCGLRASLRDRNRLAVYSQHLSEHRVVEWEAALATLHKVAA